MRNGPFFLLTFIAHFFTQAPLSAQISANYGIDLGIFDEVCVQTEGRYEDVVSALSGRPGWNEAVPQSGPDITRSSLWMYGDSTNLRIIQASTLSVPGMGDVDDCLMLTQVGIVEVVSYMQSLSPKSSRRSTTTNADVYAIVINGNRIEMSISVYADHLAIRVIDLPDR